MSTIQEQIEILVALQGVEMALTRTDGHIKALTAEAVDLDTRAAERESALTVQKGALDVLKKAYRALEAETSVNNDLIAKSNGKLRVVKTNKEYQSILKEIDDIRKKTSDIEDQMLAQLDQIESQQAAIETETEQFDGFLESCRRKKQAIETRIADEQQTIAALHRKMASIRETAAPDVIAVLDKVKGRVRGMAVVPAQGEVCMGCHMNIPAQLFNELLRFEELKFCPHCHRIIYWKEKDQE